MRIFSINNLILLPPAFPFDVGINTYLAFNRSQSPISTNMDDNLDKEKEKGIDTTATLTADEAFFVTFTEPFDSENPKDWPTLRKWAATGVLSSTGFNRIMVSTIMAPALPTIALELHMSNVESVMAMSVYLLATAFGPLLIGPLSEIYGRKPVLHTTNIWFLIWNIVCGFAHNKGVLISARLLAGFGASAIYALGGGVLGDVWRPEQRGRSLGLYMLIPLLAAAIGPIVGGFITVTTTWRVRKQHSLSLNPITPYFSPSALCYHLCSGCSPFLLNWELFLSFLPEIC